MKLFYSFKLFFSLAYFLDVINVHSNDNSVKHVFSMIICDSQKSPFLTHFTSYSFDLTKTAGK